MFIVHALVEGDWQTHHAFVAANAELRTELASLAIRVRRRDLLLDDVQSLVDFYDRRVGLDVTSAGHFERWWKNARRTEPDLLTMTIDDLLDTSEGPLRLDDFPLCWRQGELELDVSYVFEPGAADDGVTVHVPAAVLNRVTPAGFDWQVPGLRGELVTAMIRTLPKVVRRHLVPAGEFAALARPRLDPAAPGSLAVQLAGALRAIAPVAVGPDDFQLDRLPDHLRITFVVEDAEGKLLGVGKDLAVLQQSLRGHTRLALARSAAPLEQRGLTGWTIGDLPRRVTTSSAGHELEGFPALVDDGASVSVRVLTNARTQQLAMHAGTRRLLRLTLAAPVRGLERSGLTNEARLAVVRAGLGSVGELIDDCITAALDQLIERHGGPSWTAAEFESLQRAVKGDLSGSATSALSAAGRIAIAAAALSRRLDGLVAESLAPSVADARRQLARLVRPGFVAGAGIGRLDDIARYVQGIERRLDKLAADPRRDQLRAAQAQTLEQRYQQLVDALPPRSRPPELAEIRWQLEELRISLFAQVLGTKGSISEQRIRRELAALTP